MRLETLLETESVRVCCWRSLFVQSWVAAPLPHHQDQVGEAFEVMIERYADEGFITLSILSMKGLPASPPAEVREKSRRQFARTDPYVNLSAFVFELSGFGSRSVKTFMKALLLLTRPKAETRTFDALGEGVDWLVNHDRCETALAAEQAEFCAALDAWRLARDR